MAERSKIEWCDATFNPWTGCTKVSAACDHCYAEGWAKRSGHVQWGPHGARRRTKTWGGPVKWNARAAAEGRRLRVFCASLADVFDNHRSIEPEWREDLWRLIEATPSLDWLLLTKRPQNIMRFLPSNWGAGYRNVWLGTTVENQEEADRRLPHLFADFGDNTRFVSCEPLLGPLDLTEWLHEGSCRGPDPGESLCLCRQRAAAGDMMEVRLDWIIVGGESGPGARPSHPEWFRSLRDQCAAADVPFLFKQHGDWIGVEDLRRLPAWLANPGGFGPFDHCPYDMEAGAVRIGKKAAGRAIDGRTWDEIPEPASA